MGHTATGDWLLANGASKDLRDADGKVAIDWREEDEEEEEEREKGKAVVAEEQKGEQREEQKEEQRESVKERKEEQKEEPKEKQKAKAIEILTSGAERLASGAERGARDAISNARPEGALTSVEQPSSPSAPTSVSADAKPGNEEESKEERQEEEPEEAWAAQDESLVLGVDVAEAKAVASTTEGGKYLAPAPLAETDEASSTTAMQGSVAQGKGGGSGRRTRVCAIL
jgi:hypothetical protein